MSEQQDEIQKLADAKNQILDEKKQLKRAFEELQAKLEQVTGERDAAQGELERITIHQPRQELLEQVAAEGRAGMLERELLHHYELVRTDDGQDVLQKDGETIAPFSPEGIDKLHKDELIPGIGALLRGSGATGGGATGGSVNGTVTTRTPETKGSAFGLR